MRLQGSVAWCLTSRWCAALLLLRARLGCAQEAGLCEQQRAFDFFDRDRDARVTMDDFAWAMEHLGLTGEGTVGLTKARRIRVCRSLCCLCCDMMMPAPVHTLQCGSMPPSVHLVMHIGCSVLAVKHSFS